MLARFATSLLALAALSDAAAWLGKLQRRASEVPTLSPTSCVKGKAFDRIAIIWLENTDYDKAIGDRELTSNHPESGPSADFFQPILLGSLPKASRSITITRSPTLVSQTISLQSEEIISA